MPKAVHSDEVGEPTKLSYTFLLETPMENVTAVPLPSDMSDGSKRSSQRVVRWRQYNAIRPYDTRKQAIERTSLGR